MSASHLCQQFQPSHKVTFKMDESHVNSDTNHSEGPAQKDAQDFHSPKWLSYEEGIQRGFTLPRGWNVKQPLGANPGVCWEPVGEQRGFTPPLGWNVKQQLGTNPGVCSEPVGEQRSFTPPLGWNVKQQLGTNPGRTVKNTAELKQSQQDRAAKLSASVQDKQLACRLLHLYSLSQSSYMSGVDHLRRHQGERLQHRSQPGKKLQNRRLQDVKSEELPQAKKTLAEDDQESLFSSSSSSQMGTLQEVISWDDMNDGGRGETGSDKDCTD